LTLKEKIETIVIRKDWPKLSFVLKNLSNSEFRRVQPIVRNEILPRLTNEDFWEAFSHFLDFRPQAFLSCVHCIGALTENGTLNLNNQHIITIGKQLDEIQRQKLISMALHYLPSEQAVRQIFAAMRIDSPDTRISLFIRESTPLTYYLLFKTLKEMPDHHDKCVSCCRQIMKKQDDLSYNMASILRTYFGLNEIHGQLSLKVEQYELSYIEQSFEKFRFVLEGRRPVV
jgi:hypothetical protein